MKAAIHQGNPEVQAKRQQELLVGQLTINLAISGRRAERDVVRHCRWPDGDLHVLFQERALRSDRRIVQRGARGRLGGGVKLRSGRGMGEEEAGHVREARD